jgi:hypothetical protein
MCPHKVAAIHAAELPISKGRVTEADLSQNDIRTETERGTHPDSVDSTISGEPEE